MNYQSYFKPAHPNSIIRHGKPPADADISEIINIENPDICYAIIDKDVDDERWEINISMSTDRIYFLYLSKEMTEEEVNDYCQPLFDMIMSRRGLESRGVKK